MRIATDQINVSIRVVVVYNVKALVYAKPLWGRGSRTSKKPKQDQLLQEIVVARTEEYGGGRRGGSAPDG